MIDYRVLKSGFEQKLFVNVWFVSLITHDLKSDSPISSNSMQSGDWLSKKFAIFYPSNI